MKKLTVEEKLAKLEENQNKLLESLVEEKKAREKAEKKLETKELVEKKEKDPMSGPGKVCEVITITHSEAWQVPSIEVINPETQTVETKPNMAMVPEGYAVRLGPGNATFIVKKEHQSRKDYKLDSEVIIPTCQSKYTRELTVFTKKAAIDRGNFKKDPPRITLHLCERHEKMFGAITKKEAEKNK